MNEIDFDELNARMQKYVRWFQKHGCTLQMCYDDGAGYQSAILWQAHEAVVLLDYDNGNVRIFIDE